MPKFDGVASFWFAARKIWPHFAITKPALAEQGLLDPDFSFFVHAREVEIFNLHDGRRRYRNGE